VRIGSRLTGERWTNTGVEIAHGRGCQPDLHPVAAGDVAYRAVTTPPVWERMRGSLR
jgi:hypothetical protein